jgi:hypothetical protein
MNTRRNFIAQLVVTAATPALLCSKLLGQTPAPVKLEESDPMATALGYKEDTAKVDATKYAQHKSDQKCSGCALYQSKAGEANGPCAAFGGKRVLAGGWCAAFAKKPQAAK